MRYLFHTVTAAEDGRQAESILLKEMRLSASLIRRLKHRPDGVLVRSARQDNAAFESGRESPAGPLEGFIKVYTTVRVSLGDVIAARIGDDDPPRVPPVPMTLDILYEDADLIVLNKPAGICVHPTKEEGLVSLEHGFAAYLGPGEGFHPVSRLDKGTSGLMTVAKNGYMHELLRQQLHTEDLYREYRAVAVGMPCPAEGVIDAPIGFAPGSKYERAVRPEGAPSVTVYRVLSVHGAGDGTCSLLQLLPKTGRTHQLRVHMAHIGHPLVGDWLYGTEEPERIGRPALHSHILRLRHPLTGELLEFTAPIPEDMLSLLKERPAASDPGR